MTYQLATAKVWNGTAWVAAAGGSREWLLSHAFSSSLVTVTASSTIHTKGAWTEIVASTGAMADCLMLCINSLAVNGQDTATLFDIGTGAAGAEAAIVSNIAVGSAIDKYCVPVPVYVPTGSRLSIRSQSIRASQTASVGLVGMVGPNPTATSTTATVIGSSTATSAGTAMSATNNTYVELIASTISTYGSIVLVPSASASGLGAVTFRTFSLGVGTAGAEVELVSVISTTSTNESINLWTGGLGCLALTMLPAGSRLAAKVTTSTTTVDACVIATEVIGL